MPSQEDIQQQEELLATYRRTLATYLRRLAALSEVHAPPEVFRGIEEARAGIARCKAALRGWDVEVADLPDDEVPRPAGLEELTARYRRQQSLTPMVWFVGVSVIPALIGGVLIWQTRQPAPGTIQPTGALVVLTTPTGATVAPLPSPTTPGTALTALALTPDTTTPTWQCAARLVPINGTVSAGALAYTDAFTTSLPCMDIFVRFSVLPTPTYVTVVKCRDSSTFTSEKYRGRVRIKQRQRAVPGAIGLTAYTLPHSYQTEVPMDDEERQHMRELIRSYQSRLRVLELQAAKFGDHTPPQVLTEIVDIQAAIARANADLAAVTPAVERSMLRQLRQRALTAYYAQEWEHTEELLIRLLAAKPEDQDARVQLDEVQRQLDLRACYQALRDLRAVRNWAAVLVGLDDLERRQPGYPDVDGLRVWAEEWKRRASTGGVPASIQADEELRLPTLAPSTMPVGKVLEREQPLRGLYLVIVESDLKTGSLLAAILKQLGTVIVEVRTGLDHAKHLLVDTPAPDMVLIDQTLSGRITGIDVALWMQTQMHLRRTLRVLLSGAPPEVMTQWVDQGLFHSSAGMCFACVGALSVPP